MKSTLSRQEQLERIIQTQSLIAEADLDLDVFMQLVVNQLQELTEAKGAVIELVDGDFIVYKATSSALSHHLNLRLSRKNSLSGLCVKSATILYCENTETDARVDANACRSVGVRSMICTPLFENGKVVGVLKVMSELTSAFDQEDIQLLGLMAGVLGAALGKQLLFDSMTKMQQKLRQSEQRLLRLYESTPALMQSTNINDEILSISDALIKKLGYEREEVIGRSSLNFFTPESRKHVLEAILPAFSNKDYYHNIPCQIVTKSGSTLDVLFSRDLERDAQGDVIRSLEVIEDITERLALERQLEEKRKRFEYIIESTNTGSWEWNIQTGAAAFNERWCEIIGFTLKELEPVSVATWLEFLHPEDKQKSDDLLDRHFKEQSERYECEVRMRHRNGYWVWVLSRGQIMTYTKDGRPERMFGTHEEITQRVAEREVLQNLNITLEKRVEEKTVELASILSKLHQSQEELIRSEAKALLSTLTASVSHELNSPIGNSVLAATTLSGLSRELRMSMEKNALKKAQLVKAIAEIDAGAVIIDRNLKRAEVLLNSFRQVAADQSSEQRRHFDLAVTVQEVIDTIAPTLKRKPHKVDMAIPSGIVMDSIPGAIGQIIINLINNAYLHAFENRTNGVVTINAETTSEVVSISISDNGCGMNDVVLNRLFQPFYSTKIGQGGTGLGMSIVKNIVNALGGKIRVFSEVSVGTIFKIHLPLTTPKYTPLK
ncbi:PAS domain S-box protein [Undibacterium jejuense]|uniref:histidine kinase n=1 Tax=Undibacterium jejuense TaxID=1344949 RepID=A0A923HL70_9BURK|nr:PAS domain S-box protein [Undibacterium jejuense]MBC3864305.1 PAS domain S-box protein [Undibacterium jejuense]